MHIWIESINLKSVQSCVGCIPMEETRKWKMKNNSNAAFVMTRLRRGFFEMIYSFGTSEAFNWGLFLF